MRAKVSAWTDPIVNRLDTFKIVFPEEDEFLEINFCVDTFAYMRQLMESLNRSDDFLGKVLALSCDCLSCEKRETYLLRYSIR